MLRTLVSLALPRRPIVLVVLAALVGAGVIALSNLEVEAYPIHAPIILEITARAPGLSAKEMERYYTTPMEVALAATPGVNIVRSASFHALSFVRVTFAYGIDYYFAYTHAARSLQRNISLPNNVVPQIRASSPVGEIYRYQPVVSPHFGLLFGCLLGGGMLLGPGMLLVAAPALQMLFPSRPHPAAAQTHQCDADR
jgi:cobalt-zinc-cadmium resistance protein CzcA